MFLKNRGNVNFSIKLKAYFPQFHKAGAACMHGTCADWNSLLMLLPFRNWHTYLCNLKKSRRHHYSVQGLLNSSTTQQHGHKGARSSYRVPIKLRPNVEQNHHITQDLQTKICSINKSLGAQRQPVLCTLFLHGKASSWLPWCMLSPCSLGLCYDTLSPHTFTCRNEEGPPMLFFFMLSL